MNSQMKMWCNNDNDLQMNSIKTVMVWSEKALIKWMSCKKVSDLILQKFVCKVHEYFIILEELGN